ncbi:MAG: hypothetical protein KDM64_19485, partial [Verrucomicrobiae bacterium]|nr:hypothetical protein [Verrucomicrobiae bacterium]
GRSGATLFGLLLGTYQILLHRLSRQSRFVVGFPAAGQGFGGKEDLVGHCVNFLPFVAEIDRETSFGAFLRKTQSDLLDAQDHQDCTYGRLIKQSGALRLPGERPQTEAAFNFEKMEDTMDLPGLKVTVRELERRFVNYPIFLKTCESRNGLELRFDFQLALFDPATIREWLDTYRAMLQAIVDDAEVPVKRVAAVISDRQRGLLEEWNRTEIEYPRDKTVSQLFEEIVESSGADLAIRVDGTGLSYGQLGELTDR